MQKMLINSCKLLQRYEGMGAHTRTGDVRLKKYGYLN